MAQSKSNLLLSVGVALAATCLTLIIVARTQSEDPPLPAGPSDPSEEAQVQKDLRQRASHRTPVTTATHLAPQPELAPSTTPGDEEPWDGPARVTLGGHVPTSASVEDILSLLVLPNLEPNRNAIQRLVDLKDPSVVDALLARLGNGSSPLERAALEALGALGAHEAFDACLPYLSSDDAELRRTALSTLSVWGDARSATALLEHLNRGHEEDQQSTLRALSNAPFPGVGERLVGYLEHPDKELRRTAAASLASLGDLSVLDDVLAASKHKDRFVRRHMATTLSNSRDPRALPGLRELARSDSDVRVRGNAIEGLGFFGETTDITLLQQLIQSDNDWIAEQACIALKRLGG